MQTSSEMMMHPDANSIVTVLQVTAVVQGSPDGERTTAVGRVTLPNTSADSVRGGDIFDANHTSYALRHTVKKSRREIPPPRAAVAAVGSGGDTTAAIVVVGGVSYPTHCVREVTVETSSATGAENEEEKTTTTVMWLADTPGMCRTEC